MKIIKPTIRDDFHLLLGVLLRKTETSVTKQNQNKQSIKALSLFKNQIEKIPKNIFNEFQGDDFN